MSATVPVPMTEQFPVEYAVGYRDAIDRVGQLHMTDVDIARDRLQHEVDARQMLMGNAAYHRGCQHALEAIQKERTA